MQCVDSVQVLIQVQKKEIRKQREQTKGCTASKEKVGKEGAQHLRRGREGGESTGSDIHEVKMLQRRKTAAGCPTPRPSISVPSFQVAQRA